jgi:sortase (surface protein transpeptidase)
MADRAFIGLDNPAFSGRLRQPLGEAQSSHVDKPTRPSTRYFNDFVNASAKQGSLNHQPYVAPTAASRDLSIENWPGTQNQATVKPQATPARDQYVKHAAAEPVVVEAHKPQRSEVLFRKPFFITPEPIASELDQPKTKFSIRRMVKGYSRLQYGMFTMAFVIFAVGISVSWMTLRTNSLANTRVAALSSAAVDEPATSDVSANASVGNSTKAASTPPSTVKPSAAAVENYAVGPNMPKYLNIPKLGVHARVLSLGLLNSGALATPNNVFDVGWYNESSLPGQPGAELIDGHVSSWTSHGVFYGIKTLTAGDEIQVVTGDNTTYTYKVVSHQVFSHTDVNMQTSITPITPGQPGLNLITCTGDVIPGTSEFNERILVYATLESS